MRQFLAFANLARLRTALLAGLCLVASFAFSAPARAIVITSNGSVELIDLNGPDTVAPLENISRLSFDGGRLYTNQVNGAPFALGSTVRTVGVVTLGSAINGTNQPAVLPNGSSMLAIFGVEGTISASLGGGLIAARFTKGRVFLASDATGNAAPPFNLNDPTSWNFAQRFSEYRLLEQDFVVDGTLFGIEPSSNLLFAPSDTNVSGANTVVQVGAQGVFLFGEDSPAAPPAGFVNPGLGANTGDSWLRDVDRPAFLLPGFGLEGAVLITNQIVLSSVAGADGTGESINPTVDGPTGSTAAAKLAALNVIGNASFGADFTGGGYTPTGFGAGTGDFIADLTAEAHISISAVPEPSSLLLFAFGGGALALAIRRRRSAA